MCGSRLGYNGTFDVSQLRGPYMWRTSSVRSGKELAGAATSHHSGFIFNCCLFAGFGEGFRCDANFLSYPGNGSKINGR